MIADKRLNNFDLIRLFAALQVVFSHTIEHFGLYRPTLLDAFSGVPIFFVISGFLISTSYENSTLKDYTKKRLKRIYPGLWGCLIFSILILMWGGAIDINYLTSSDFIIWLTGQLTIVQIYNPDQFRNFGVGVINGSLWTIPVEVGFYIALPIILLGKKAGIYATLIISCVAYAVFLPMKYESIYARALFLTVAPYLWIFLLGVVLKIHFEKIRP